MKIKDIIMEGEFRPGVSDPMVKTDYYPELPSSSPYMTYRFGMGMADHTTFHPNGPAKNSAVIAQYSDAEEEIVAATEKKLGKFGKKTLADKGSSEPVNTNKVSPVASKRKTSTGYNMRINEIVVEADPNELGDMNDKMKDVLSQVHAGDVEKERQEKERKEQAKADEIKAAKMYALKHPEEVEDYIKKLRNHDWAYDYSDDYRSWTKGSAEAREIDILKKKLDPNGELYDKYNPFNKEGLGETASSGATSAGNIASVEAPHLSPGKARGKTSYTGKPNGPSGTKAPPQPKVKQPKKKDGTAVNALDMKSSIFGENPVKR